MDIVKSGALVFWGAAAGWSDVSSIGVVSIKSSSSSSVMPQSFITFPKSNLPLLALVICGGGEGDLGLCCGISVG